MNGSAVFSESNTKSSAAKSCTYLDVNEPANSISKLNVHFPFWVFLLFKVG